MPRKTSAKRSASQTEETSASTTSGSVEKKVDNKQSQKEEEIVTSKNKRTKEKEKPKEVPAEEADNAMNEEEMSAASSTPAASFADSSRSASSSSSSSSSMLIDTLPKAPSTTGTQQSLHMKKCFACGAIEPREIRVPNFIVEAEEAAKEKGIYLQVIEIGRLVFHYRPKLGITIPKSLDDVQRLHMVMEALNTPLGNDAQIAAEWAMHHIRHLKMVKQHERESKQEALKYQVHLFEPKGITSIRGCEPQIFRLATIPAKQLPNQKGRGGSKFGVITSVSPDHNAIIEEMKEKYYHTARGDRFTEKARVLTEAIYFIARHGNRQRHTHLMFKCETGSEEEYKKSVAHRMFHIPFEGAFTIQVKNPKSKAQDPRGRAPQVDYPDYLQCLFTGLRKEEVRFAPADPVALLNYIHSQFILQFSTDDLFKNYDEVAHALETEEKEDVEEWEKAEYKKILHDLYLEQTPHAVVDATSARKLV